MDKQKFREAVARAFNLNGEDFYTKKNRKV